MKRLIGSTILAGVTILMMPSLAHACACGCGVFEVGTGAMLPTGPGGTAWFEVDHMDQGQNWHGTNSAPKENNDDKELRSTFYTAGAQYMFNRTWGVMAEVPYTDRYFRTDDGGGETGYRHGAMGDIRLKGIYSGFSEDMSSGLTFGIKLPTGEFDDHNFDRDTAIGSGSTDALLGGYHMGALTVDNQFDWFTSINYDHPVATHDGYRPGDEIDAAIGSYYNKWYIGDDKIAPLLQLIVSRRWADAGVNADPENSGYSRLLISPGVEYDVGRTKLYGDVEFPVYQDVRGNQIVAPVFLKFSVAYNF